MNDKYYEFMEIDVKDEEQLLSYGYVKKHYYCGNSSFEDLWTNIVNNKLKEYGFLPIYNPACFKHDLLYSLKPDLKFKKKIDREFGEDMLYLYIQHLRDHGWNCKSIFRGFRLVVYFNLIKLFTPIYQLQGKIKK